MTISRNLSFEAFFFFDFYKIDIYRTPCDLLLIRRLLSKLLLLNSLIEINNEDNIFIYILDKLNGELKRRKINIFMNVMYFIIKIIISL